MTSFSLPLSLVDMLKSSHHAKPVDSMEPAACQICYKDLTSRTLRGRQEHYDNHFVDKPERASSAVPSPSRPAAQTEHSFQGHVRSSPERENRFWYPSKATSAPSNFSPGLIPVLKESLLKAHAQGGLQRAALCYERTVHIAMEVWDLGWGCGYRNFLMACAALMDQQAQPMYFPLLDTPTPPGVRHLQHWIEDAWAKGYDKEGAMQLKNKLSGTRKWIGTGELYVAFTSRGIPCRLVDFKPGSLQSLLDWVVLYFTPPQYPAAHATVDDALRGASPVVCTDRMPLILQHPGHSRLIVGYEMTASGAVNLLIFDPAKRPSSQFRAAGLDRSPAAPPAASASRRQDGSHRHHHLSPSWLIHKAHRALNSKRHPSQDMDVIDVDAEPDAPIKRSGQDEETEDDEVVCVDPPPEASGPNRMRGGHMPETPLKPAQVIKFFRVTPKRLGTNGRYQILHFPLTDPLSEEEKRARRELISTKVF